MEKVSAKTVTAWAIAIFTELTAAALPTVITALWAIPYARAFRDGRVDFGGEYYLIAAVFAGTFALLHYGLCRIVLPKRR